MASKLALWIKVSEVLVWRFQCNLVALAKAWVLEFWSPRFLLVVALGEYHLLRTFSRNGGMGSKSEGGSSVSEGPLLNSEGETSNFGNNSKLLTSKELDYFITTLLSDKKTKYTWISPKALVKNHKKNGGPAILLELFRKVDGMQKQLLPEKITQNEIKPILAPHLRHLFGV